VSCAQPLHGLEHPGLTTRFKCNARSRVHCGGSPPTGRKAPKGRRLGDVADRCLESDGGDDDATDGSFVTDPRRAGDTLRAGDPVRVNQLPLPVTGWS
jgi:hypothetical protein